jgi:hypothetical protein
MHPQPRVRFVVLVCTRVFTAEAPETSGIPHAMVLRLIRDLPGDLCLVATVTRETREHLRDLSACFGAPEPHDFAVRLKRRSSCVASASTASHPAFVTTRTPLLSRRDGGNNTQFPIFGKRNFCAWRADNPNRLESSREIRSCAHAFSRCLRPRARRERRRIDQTDLPVVGRLTCGRETMAEPRGDTSRMWLRLLLANNGEAAHSTQSAGAAAETTRAGGRTGRDA